MASEDRHFHIGELRKVARKRFCPGCRLILFVARSMNLSHNEINEATITIYRCPFEPYIREPADNLRETTVDEDNVERPLYMECFIEVILDGVYSPYEAPEHRTAGIIIRMEETGSVDPSSLKSKISESVLPEVNTSLIKQWIQSCSFQHDRCRLPDLPTAREQSIRLIDVEDHRIIPATSVEKYVALSYVRGSTMTPSLTQDTFSECSPIGGLKDLVIPRTIIDVMDYGFLRFTAQTAVLTLRWAEERSGNLGTIVDGDEADRYKRIRSRVHLVEATIYPPQGKQIGMLRVPFSFFNEKSERTSEVVLLSSNAERESDRNCKKITREVDCGRFEHVKGCRHIQSRNIMLIEWDRNIAYRRGLGTVDKNSWKDVKTEIKEIMLG